MKRLAPLLLIGVLTLFSCSDGGATLIVYSGRSEELVQPVIDMFEEDTGIEVTVRYASSTEQAATLLQEGASTQADVFYAQDPASLGSVSQLMAPIDPEILKRIEPRFHDRDGLWVGTSGRVRVFVYNTSTTRPLPQTIDEVNDPAWFGAVGVAPTNGSFLSFVSAMILERGEEATRDWLSDLAANSPNDYPANAPIVSAVDNGDLDGGLVNHYYLIRLRAEGAGKNAENYYIPAGDVGSLIMTAGAAILANSDMPDEATRFVDYLLSEPAQAHFANVVFEYPLIEGVPPAEGLPPLDSINSPDIDLSDLAGVLDDAIRLVTEAGLV